MAAVDAAVKTLLEKKKLQEKAASCGSGAPSCAHLEAKA